MDNKDYFVVTPEMVKKATSYLPLTRKTAIAKTIANDSVRAINRTEMKKQSDSIFSLPQIYNEDAISKRLNLMVVFLEDYLHVSTPEEMSGKEYDFYAGGHLFNQLERMKSHPEVKDIVYDMLADYKELKKMVDIEIYNIMLEKNDSLERFLAGIAVSTSPEALERVSKEIAALKSEELNEPGGNEVKS